MPAYVIEPKAKLFSSLKHNARCRPIKIPEI